MPPPTHPEFVPGTQHLLILRSLSAGSLHGYAIATRIKDVSQSILAVDEGSMYPPLNRLLVKRMADCRMAHLKRITARCASIH